MYYLKNAMSQNQARVFVVRMAQSLCAIALVVAAIEGALGTGNPAGAPLGDAPKPADRRRGVRGPHLGEFVGGFSPWAPVSGGRGFQTWAPFNPRNPSAVSETIVRPYAGDDDFGGQGMGGLGDGLGAFGPGGIGDGGGTGTGP